MTKFNEAATALENRTQEQMQKKAMDSLREEYPKYFELLTQGTQSARLLVGKRVPAASPDEPGQDAEGFVVLKDSADAKDWVEATKALIGAEAQTRAVKLMESEGPQMQVLHRTIDLFRNNPDIIPQTKGYNDALTRKFLAMAKPYEHRTEDGKLLGYTIDVQPLLSNLRSQAAEQPAAPAPVAPAAAAPAAPAQEPQSGIPSKAGAGADGESWDDFWTTMGIKPPMNL